MAVLGGGAAVNVLVFTNMYPYPEMPYYGSFVHDEVAALQKKGCSVDVLFVNGRRNKLSYLTSPARFQAAMRRKTYDLVHVHHSFCGFVATFQKKVPVVWTFHEGEIMGDGSIAKRDGFVKRLAYSKSFKRRVARSVDALVVVSEHLRGPLGRPDAVVIPAGLDTDLFAPADQAAARRELHLAERRRYVLFPSTPSRPEKRFPLARDAVDRVRRVVDDVELICLEGIPHEKVPDYMNAVDALLMTSSFEASPVTVREALACNLPVVCTDVGDVRDVLHGVEQCAVVTDDADDIAEALAGVLRAGLRSNGRRFVEGYSLERTTEQLLQVYREVLERGPRRKT
jgi:teichuronic acid biosynthesis glycosyltransferase TuaC